MEFKVLGFRGLQGCHENLLFFVSFSGIFPCLPESTTKSRQLLGVSGSPPTSSERLSDHHQNMVPETTKYVQNPASRFANLGGQTGDSGG